MRLNTHYLQSTSACSGTKIPLNEDCTETWLMSADVGFLPLDVLLMCCDAVKLGWTPFKSLISRSAEMTQKPQILSNWHNVSQICHLHQSNFDLQHVYNSHLFISHMLSIIHRWCHIGLLLCVKLCCLWRKHIHIEKRWTCDEGFNGCVISPKVNIRIIRDIYLGKDYWNYVVLSTFFKKHFILTRFFLLPLDIVSILLIVQ